MGGGGGGERISLRCRQVTSKVPKTMKNLFPLQFCSWDGSFRHGEVRIWLCLYFQHVTRYIGTDFVEESRQNAKIRKGAFFAKGALIGKSIFQIQRVNAVHGRCPSSGVLRDIPSRFTQSVRRRIVIWCLSPERWNRYVAMAERSEQMGRGTRTSALPIRNLRQIAYLLPLWGGIWSGAVFLWRRLTFSQNNSLRMFWYRDLNSSHFFSRFGALEHEANRIPDISATFIGSRKKVNATACLFVPQDNKSRVFCLSLTGWIVWIDAADEELHPLKICATWYTTINFPSSQNCHSLRRFSQFWEQRKTAGG